MGVFNPDSSGERIRHRKKAASRSLLNPLASLGLGMDMGRVSAWDMSRLPHERTRSFNAMFPQAYRAVAFSSRRFSHPLAVPSASTPSLLSRQKTSAPSPPPAAPRTRHDPDPFSNHPGHHEPVPAWDVDGLANVGEKAQQRLESSAAPPTRPSRPDTFRAAVAAKDHRRLHDLFWEMAKKSPALLSSLTLSEVNAVLFAISVPRALPKAGDEARVQALDAILRVVEKTRAAVPIRNEQEGGMEGKVNEIGEWAKGASAGFGDADTRRAMVRVFAQGPCERGRLRRVVEELEAMCGGAHGVDRETRIAIMAAFGRAGDFGEAVRRFQELIGERAETLVGNTLLDALCRTNVEAKIIDTFESMKTYGPPPDAETYRSVVGFYMQRKRHDRVVELWYECIARGIDQANALRVIGISAALAMLEVGQPNQFDRILGALAQEKMPDSNLHGLQIIAAEKRADVEEVWRLLPELLKGKRKVPLAAWKALARVVGPISASAVLKTNSAEKEKALAARESTSSLAVGHPPDSTSTPADASAASPPAPGQVPSSIDSSRARNFENLMVRLGLSRNAMKHPVGEHLVRGYIALGDTESALAIARAKIPERWLTKSYSAIVRHILSQTPSPTPFQASTIAPSTPPPPLPAILSLLDEMPRALVSPESVYAESIWLLTERGDLPAVMTLLSRLETLNSHIVECARRSLVNLSAAHHVDLDEDAKVDPASREGSVAQCRRALAEALNRFEKLHSNPPRSSPSSGCDSDADSAAPVADGAPVPASWETVLNETSSTPY
ncbi:hypothetical protein BDK51DRAFT_49713 [Blyttiomyces helicus]|uniref:Pentacotripeptide-repeat region of PRORP domain-containing protein n=1 Tax=Blyttiomyces helicus TaxID=388810 RepID=A0A4P9WHH0_9FUNG|nr:hypothetical protein BDK51DRAFT_49713 [Blyttiomyces helicus]|eukprot:RKO92184.1 hypothetical protein BDK51DRAFT_49713 [Blyttiomyces helicus]